MKKLLLFLVIILLNSCAVFKKTDRVSKKEETVSLPTETVIEISDEVIKVADKIGLSKSALENLIEKPLYAFEPAEVDEYLKLLQTIEPDIRKRIDHLAKKMIGQKYEIYLLGEYPFEIYDPQPLYCIDRSDCVVFSEHIYAMALSDSWKKFFSMLQRIRYKDGVIGLLTRNHYTEADWTVNNPWLIKNITDSLQDVKSIQVTSKIDRAKFFSKWNIGQDIPVEELKWSYIPASEVPKALKYLKTGDFVNVVRGFSPQDVYVGHVGLISIGKDSVVYLIHSAEPVVRMEPLINYMNRSLKLNERRKKENEEIVKKNLELQKFNDSLRVINNGLPHPDEKKLQSLKPYFYGFRFFELQENAFENLKKIDGQKAPKLTIYGED